MKEFTVVIPEGKYSVVDFIQKGFPGVAFINIALRDFEPKIVFAWHLSLMIDFEDLIENGMPSRGEREIVDEFEKQIGALLKGTDPEKPNAIFLARITWNETRELIWRIYEPARANDILQEIINQNSSPRPFDFRMDDDREWKLAEWHLSDHKK